MKSLILASTLILFSINGYSTGKSGGSCKNVTKKSAKVELTKKAKGLAVLALVNEIIDTKKAVSTTQWMELIQSSKDSNSLELISELTSDFSKPEALLKALNVKSIEQLVQAELGSSKLSRFKSELSSELGVTAVTFFSKTLRSPSLEELSAKLKVDSKLIQTIYSNDELTQIWEAALESETQKVRDVKMLLQRAVASYFRQTKVPQGQKRILGEPTAEDIFNGLTKAVKREDAEKPLEIKHVERLIGDRQEKANKIFKAPQVFENIDELLRFTYKNSPNSLNAFWPTAFGRSYADETLNILKNNNRFLVTSITAGIPIDNEQLLSMLSYAEKNDAHIIVGVANRNFMAIPPILLKHPRIRIVTHSFDLGSELRIFDIPIYPKNKNPFASLDGRSIGERGQTQIVFSPQLMMNAVDTADNYENSHEMWATGSLNINAYPYKNKHSGRLSYLASERHFNGFLILEKSDAASGKLGRGAPGQWHIRPATYVDDRKHGGKVGFTDVGLLDGKVTGVHYSPDGSVSENKVTVRGEGDNHDRFQQQNMLAAIYEQMPLPTEAVTQDDGLDGDSINHWERGRPSQQAKRYAQGRLPFIVEYNEYMSTINSRIQMYELLGLDTSVVFKRDNHTAWPDRYLETMPADAVNQRVINILLAAKSKYSMGPVEYLATKFHEDLALEEPSVQRALSGLVVKPHDVDRLIFKPAHFVTGPPHRQNHNGFHGDKGAAGRPSTDKADSEAMDGGSTGHRHRKMILPGLAKNGQLVINFGTSGDQRVEYAAGGYSRWSHGIRVEFEDGTAQAYAFKVAIDSFYARDDKGYLSPEDFFTREPEVMPDQNELINPDEFFVDDQYSQMDPEQVMELFGGEMVQVD